MPQDHGCAGSVLNVGVFGDIPWRGLRYVGLSEGKIVSDPVCQNCQPFGDGWLCRGFADPKCGGVDAGAQLVTDANGKPYRFGMTGSAGESDAPTVTCFRCGDTIPKVTDICTSIADCVNFKIRSKWIIPGDGK